MWSDSRVCVDVWAPSPHMRPLLFVQPQPHVQNGMPRVAMQSAVGSPGHAGVCCHLFAQDLQHFMAPGEGRDAPHCFGLKTATSCAVSITDCDGLESLPKPIGKDATLFFDSIDVVVCDKPVTLTVDNGTELSVRLTTNSGDIGVSEKASASESESGLRLNNVRIVVEGGGRLTVGIGVGPAEVALAKGGQQSNMLTLAGTVAQQGSDGGALEVKQGGAAVFLVPVRFEANAVADGSSGGALHVEGEVRFEQAAHFQGNRCSAGNMHSRNDESCGGAVFIGRSGKVGFSEFASFEDNSAGHGGALCNRGKAKFSRRSFFSRNQALGGDGGALRAEEEGETTFLRKSTMLNNFATGSGGAVYNAGTTSFETSAVFMDNEAAAVLVPTVPRSPALELASAVTQTVPFAAVDPRGVKGSSHAGGGHLFNRGRLNIRGDASFRGGLSSTHGGAVYAVSGQDTVLGGITSFEGNRAGGRCQDIFSSVLGSEVQLTTITVAPTALLGRNPTAPYSTLTANGSTDVGYAAASTTTSALPVASVGEAKKRRRTSHSAVFPAGPGDAVEDSRPSRSASDLIRTTPCQPPR